MYGRVDTTKYFNGARKLRNFIVAPQGGIYRRPGTRHVINSLDEAGEPSRLQEFQFSNQQVYLLEFVNNECRVLRDGVVKATLATPWDNTEMWNVRFTQSADIMFCAHPDHAPRRILRTADTSWAIDLYKFEDGPYIGTPNEIKDAYLTLTNVVSTASVESPIALFGTSVTGFTASDHSFSGDDRVKITKTAHGLTTGNTITITGLKLDATRAPRSYPYDNGTYAITVIDANNFYCPASQDADDSYDESTAYYTLATALTTYVDFREDDEWKLAKVLSFQDSTHATVDIIDAIKDTDPTVVLSVASYPTMKSTSHSGVFSRNDVNKYIRLRTTGAWYKITAYTSGTEVTVSTVTKYDYSYPTNLLKVGERLIYGTVTATLDTFVSTDLDRHIRLNFSGSQPWGKITSFVSAKIVTVEFYTPIPLDDYTNTYIKNDGITNKWRLGSWSTTTGWPSVFGFHQQRFVAANTITEPQTLWMTESSDYYSFKPSSNDDSVVLDTHAVNITLASGEVNPIMWVKSGPVLLVGTTSNEYQVKPQNVNQVVTPTNVSATVQTTFGSESFECGVRIGTQTIFVQRGGIKLREMNYDFSLDAFVSKDISIISEHIGRTYGGFIDIAVQYNPFTILWLLTGDGKLVGVTYDREQEVVAWHIHQLGGSGLIKSITCLPSLGGEQDELYLSVKRGDYTTIEVQTNLAVSSEITGADTISYVDDFVSTDTGLLLDYDNQDPNTPLTVSGIPYPNSTAVQFMVNGWYVGNFTVNSGVFETPLFKITGKCFTGFQMPCTLEVVDYEGGSGAGTSQGKKKRIFQSDIRVENTIQQFKQGITDAEMYHTTQIIPYPTEKVLIVDGIYGLKTPTMTLLSEDIRISLDTMHSDSRFQLVMDLPYPLNIVSVMPIMNTNE
jgi:hypothetical protein